MKDIVIIPTVMFDGIMFGTSRESVRKKLGANYKEYKRNSFSKNTMDIYDGFSLYYDSNSNVEAIEIYENIKVYIDNKCIYPGFIDDLLELDNEIIIDGEDVVSNKMQCRCSADNDKKIVCILFGKNNYLR